MIHVAYCFDNNYKQHFFASVTSLCLNYKNSQEDLTIHILTESMNESLEQQLNDLKATFRVTIQNYTLQKEHYSVIQQLPAKSAIAPHLNIAAYYRLFLLEMLPQEVDRIVYLDSDTIVLSSIDLLINSNLDGQLIGGVADFSESQMKAHYQINQYINSGVLLVDVKKWQAESISAQCMEQFKQTQIPLRFLDQCAINLAIEHKKPLDTKWNQFITAGNYNHAMPTEGILHFITPDKPWQAWYENPTKELYWQYLKVSPWQNSTPEMPKNIHQAIRYARQLRLENKKEEACQVYERVIEELLKNHSK